MTVGLRYFTRRQRDEGERQDLSHDYSGAQVDDVSETILLGCCHVLTASEDASSHHADGIGDEELLTALCQV